MIKKIVGLLLYNCVAKHLPVSYSLINIGQRKLRRLCGKLILTKCGKNVNIEKRASFSSRVEIGNCSGIGVRAQIMGRCIIGENVMMGPDCLILTTSHNYSDTKVPMIEQGMAEERPVYIGNDVWIGARVTILPGVKIGDGAIVGACTVVSKDIEPYSVVVGNPARKIRDRRVEN